MALALSKLGRFAEAYEVIDSSYAEVVRRQLTGTQYMEIYHLTRARVFTEEGILDRRKKPAWMRWRIPRR